MKKKILVSIAAIAVSLFASESGGKTDNRNITIIRGQSTADGSSQVGERLLEECIVSLPSAEALEPIVTSESIYLKEINGDPSRNEFMKVYSATLEINYLLHQKVLIVVTTSSIQGQEPVMKVMEKSLKQSKQFVSNAEDGDLFAGRSRRQHYFSTPEKAKSDVQNRAAAWIKQQAAVVCPK